MFSLADVSIHTYSLHVKFAVLSLLSSFGASIIFRTFWLILMGLVSHHDRSSIALNRKKRHIHKVYKGAFMLSGSAFGLIIQTFEDFVLQILQ